MACRFQPRFQSRFSAQWNTPLTPTVVMVQFIPPVVCLCVCMLCSCIVTKRLSGLRWFLVRGLPQTWNRHLALDSILIRPFTERQSSPQWTSRSIELAKILRPSNQEVKVRRKFSVVATTRSRPSRQLLSSCSAGLTSLSWIAAKLVRDGPH